VTTTVSAAPADRWQIVLARDVRYDGQFVYAVRSTGVYCRPSCPSKRPRRTMVTFFDAPAVAEQAGFRPCKRCRPTRPDESTSIVKRAAALLDERATERWSLAALARDLRTAPRIVEQAFHRVLGVSPRQYWDARRVARLKVQLKENKGVTIALFETGYSGASRVYERSNQRLGMTPATYARGGAGAAIGYTLVSTPLGRLLVAATERGVCRVAFGDADAELERGLRREFPAAHLRRDDTGVGRRGRGGEGGLAAAAQALVEHLGTGAALSEIPLDVHATAFQRRVWDALQRIPRGSTRSYAEVARAIGRPSAARAVARACASNPLAVLVPCHRVIRGDGELGGYRWSVERKRALLERERR
jgi:AraC family transcriptional regulator of adaptative response/methylated-DNA-[protein]-cysteine methyltransferase